ncbi:mycofactocin biosynthesis glycosyltransferase MftF [Nocardioides sp. AX2bis]|uniref:mycofactocin biosynthesis glycosyltransferase MftF n=1 Tax=Nocardioides sp. AX2bis TaxID=2653157 RepID=UPI0012F0848D|nr:mycofactocin biosynthesis glycosyltransferase MftF [Nocardioides sp. AX2bis]VXA95384.1 Putative mycofactocin biosynthesis glycosyltransferase MftF [Nocardioides sp. AX2bis]
MTTPPPTAAPTVAPAATPVPEGTGLRLLPGARLGSRAADGSRTLTGYGADRVLRLVPRAAGIVAGLPALVEDPVGRRLARTLLDAGVAEPWWPDAPPGDDTVADVTVVVPVHDRPDELARLLSALPRGLPVVVVDDASADPGAVATVAAAHGARLLRHAVNRGPAAARNTGLAAVTTPLVAFVDSDVVPDPGWLGTLRRHLDDPLVAVAAPRVLALAGAPSAGRLARWVAAYETDRSSLDLGARAAQVRPRAPVSYVPSACWLARVGALGGGFAEELRSGEDVDLVWRLVAGGWRVRYEPAARVRHDHRAGPAAWLRRKAFYGGSAADLARRHGDAVAPVVLTPWAAVTALALLAQRRWSLPVAGAAWGTAIVVLARRLPGERPTADAAVLATRGLGAVLTQIAASLTRHHWPLAVLAATRSRRARRAVLVAALGEGLWDHHRVGATQPRAAYVVAHRLDDLAYGAGVWVGVARARSPRALLPVLLRRPSR